MELKPRPIERKYKSPKCIDFRYRKHYPTHFTKFSNMNLPDANAPCEFPWTTEGFSKFVESIGVIPIHMKSPSVGRKDHTKPYSPDNICWQEWECNRAEAFFRHHFLFPKGFKTWQELLTISALRSKGAM